MSHGVGQFASMYGRGSPTTRYGLPPSHGAGSDTRAPLREAAELFPEMTELARRFFYFDEREYPNLTVRTGDGLRVLRESSALYDAIINDAFTGHAPSGALTGEEAIRVIRSRLAPGGIYCVNLATALRGPFYLRTGRMLRILRKYFRYTLLLPMYENRNAYEPQNCLLFASEREFRWFSLDLGEN